jgi:hypothetical protein
VTVTALTAIAVVSSLAIGNSPPAVAALPALLVAQNAAPCAVLDDNDAARALDGPVQRDTNPQSELPGTCAWRSATIAGDALTVTEEAGGQSKYDFDRERMAAAALDGTGEAAFAFESPAGFVQLGMLAGGRYVSILLQLQNDPQRLARAVALAQTIAGRL